MKTQITVFIIIGIILTSCIPQAAAQEIEVATEAPFIEVSPQESAIPEEPNSTKFETAQEHTVTKTAIATESAFTCVSQLTPENGAHLPVTGKVAFAWTAMSEAESYTLHIILPSGQIASFETDQTFRDRYLEAFVSGGEYQWQVTARSSDGNEICTSDFFVFDKPAYEKYEKPKDGVGEDAPRIVPPVDCNNTPEGCNGEQ